MRGRPVGVFTNGKSGGGFWTKPWDQGVSDQEGGTERDLRRKAGLSGGV